ncbi:hypothetical protein BX661DRAFT_185988, partial [Kickxella alabastrina]|uniref:uncharacterized protein n=1 Tax=Kickxella alabastrina TaxID=61397 RepID=UPI002220127B
MRSTDDDGMSTLKELAQKAKAEDVEMSVQTCLNMSHFKATMRELRKVDDNIILRMNNTNTAAAEDCLAFFNVLRTAYARREHDISYCLSVLEQRIAQQTPRKNTMSLESQRDWVENERSVEDIVRSRSLQVFRSRCRFFEFPPEF